MRKLILFFSIFLLVPIAYATIGTLNTTNNTKITFLVSSGITTTVNNLKISSTLEQMGIGNYSLNQNNINRSLDTGILYILVPEAEVITDVDESGYRPGARAPYYDLLLKLIPREITPMSIFTILAPDIEEKRYRQGETIRVEITILNMGDVPDRDAILSYYLLSPENETFQKNKKQFKEVLPTCAIGEYNPILDLCSQGVNTYPAHKYTEIVTLTLPINAETGNWQLIATYDTEHQELVESVLGFEVSQGYINFFIFFIILLLVILTLRQLLVLKQKRSVPT